LLIPLPPFLDFCPRRRQRRHRRPQLRDPLVRRAAQRLSLSGQALLDQVVHVGLGERLRAHGVVSSGVSAGSCDTPAHSVS
jgi:hypothetical protein